MNKKGIFLRNKNDTFYLCKKKGICFSDTGIPKVSPKRYLYFSLKSVTYLLRYLFTIYITKYKYYIYSTVYSGYIQWFRVFIYICRLLGKKWIPFFYNRN